MNIREGYVSLRMSSDGSVDVFTLNDKGVAYVTDDTVDEDTMWKDCVSFDSYDRAVETIKFHISQ